MIVAGWTLIGLAGAFLWALAGMWVINAWVDDAKLWPAVAFFAAHLVIGIALVALGSP